MFYHASQTPHITVLTPHISNHGKPLIYLSTRRENVLVYLSNAVEKCCKEIGFEHHGSFQKWASYGFTKEGVLRLEEYYPNATVDTYKGVSGFLYSANVIDHYEKQPDIPYAVITEAPVAVSSCEFIPDAYEAILEAVAEGKIVLCRYEDNSAAKLDWIKSTNASEYENAEDHPEYRAFLKAKFDFP